MGSKVALIRCKDYSEPNVASSVGQALSILGGIGKYVKPGDKVLIKPNLLASTPISSAVTTHPTVVKAVVGEVLKAGGKPVICDSPGGPYNKRMLERAYRVSGLADVASETGALLNFDTRATTVSYKEGKLLKRIDMIGVLDDVDLVITVPKMKTHALMQFTGATKILFGVVPGLTKPVYHMKFPEKDRFADMLLDILCFVKPVLSIMDGVVGLEGEGPGASGTPKDVGVILASEDSVALDVVAASVAGMDPLGIPTISKAVERGLTSGRLSDVEVVGVPVEEVMVKFRTPSGKKGVFNAVFGSKIVRSLSLKSVAPYPVSNSNCIGCGVCRQSCPAGAITITDRARMDLGRCIRCYCCHELCTHKAIDLKRNLIGNIFFG